MGKKKGNTIRIFSLLWKRIITGMFLVVPFYVTYHVVRILFNYIDSLSQPVIRRIVGQPVHGVGFVLTLILLYGLGLVAANVFGRSLVKGFESLLLRLPVIKIVYATAKQAIESLSLPGKEKFKRVVLVEYPRKGVFAIGFVTGTTKGAEGKVLLNLFMPAPPNPATGNLIFVPENEVIDTTLSIEEAAKIVISIGLITPKELTKS